METITFEKGNSEADSHYEETEESGLLPADHPLLERFQRALKEHLLKVKNQLESEIGDLDDSIKTKDEEIADVGAKLFDLQNEIETQRDQLDKYSKLILDLSDKRKEHEESAVRFKEEYEKRDASCKNLQRMNNEVLQEISSMRVLEGEITKWNNEVSFLSEVLSVLCNILTIFF